eukprot:9102340-Alexandrium_andersonii.AAC.1
MSSACSPLPGTSKGRYRFLHLSMHETGVSTQAELWCTAGLGAITFWLKLSSGGKGNGSLR